MAKRAASTINTGSLLLGSLLPFSSFISFSAKILSKIHSGLGSSAATALAYWSFMIFLCFSNISFK